MPVMDNCESCCEYKECINYQITFQTEDGLIIEKKVLCHDCEPEISDSIVEIETMEEETMEEETMEETKEVTDKTDNRKEYEKKTRKKKGEE